MVIDFSQFYCGACKSLADSHQNDSEFHDLVSGEKCGFMVALPENDRNSWLGRYNASTFIGKSSVFSMSQGSIGTAFGLNIPGIPRVFMINRKGEVVADQEGGMPSDMNDLCQ